MPTVNPEPGHVYISPLGILYLARDFLRDARLSKNEGRAKSTWFHYCHTIELALKAFLRANDFTNAQVVKIGHNLKKAYKKAVKKGLSEVIEFSEADLVELSKANKMHSSRGGSRYFDIGDVGKGTAIFDEWPDLDVLDSIAERLINAVHPVCKNAANA